MAANSSDFLREGLAAPAQAPDQDPEALAAARRAQLAAKLQADAARTASVNLADQPGQTFEGDAGYFDRKQALQAQAETFAKPDAPGNLGTDLVRMGTAGGRLLTNPVGETIKGFYPSATPFADALMPVNAVAAQGVQAGGTAALGGNPASGVNFAGQHPLSAASDALGGLGGSGGINLGSYIAKGDAQAAGARADLAGVTADRNLQAQNLFAQGAAAQGRAAPQASTVNYGPSQTVSAPTLASAAQASAGSYGSAPTIRAGQATAQQAQNAAGFLGSTAASARNVADLDFGQSNESRGAQQANLSRIGGFLDSGPGPSMAQQQLRMAQQQNLGDALALARSGRGNAAGNMKMALSENVATNAQTNQQAALLRAQEADMWQQRQLQGMGLEQTGAGQMRGQDLGAAQAQGQQALSREQLAANVDVSRAGLEQQLGISNAAQANQVGMQNAQLQTQAGLEQASLANALNIARGNAGTQVNLSNAEQQNLTSRLQGQMGLDASSQSAQLANALAIAQGNSSTQIGLGNLDAAGRQQAQNDALLGQLTGYGLDSQKMGQDALTHGIDTQTDYYRIAAQLAAEDAKARAMKSAALIGGGASVLQLLGGGK